jgi:AcrR family transcriptional regulator
MEERRGHGVRMEDVAHAAGVSRQAVYLHFASRADLLIATVRYVDEVRGVNERVERFRVAAKGVEALEAYIEFWGHYVPEIYGLARALLAVRETDAAAAAAWEDRMAVARWSCRCIIECLVRDGMLAPEWQAAEATQALWAMLSIAVWEDLTVSCGWTTSQYVHWLQVALKRTFVRQA